MSDTKESGRTTNILNYFSKYINTLAHQTKLPTYGKVNFPPINSIYLIFSYLEMQRRLIQTKAYYKLSYSVWKEVSHKSLKVAAAKKSSPSVYTIDTTWFNEFFFIPSDNWKTLFFIQIYRYPKVWYNRHVATSLKCFKRSPHFIPLWPK